MVECRGNKVENSVREIERMGVDAILAEIQAQAAARAIRITDHAREEMEEEIITLARFGRRSPPVRSSRTIQITSVDPVAYSTG